MHVLARSAAALLALAAMPALALDTWDDKIKEYLRKQYLTTTVFNTPDAVVVFLCHPSGGPIWWAYKLNNAALTDAHLLVQGATPHHSYDTGGQGHGQGVYFGHDRGPITEGGPRPGDRVAPALATATLAIRARAPDGQKLIQLGNIPARHVADIRGKCGKSLPRALAPVVLTGRNAR